MVVSEFGTCRSGRIGGCVGGEPRGMEGSGAILGANWRCRVGHDPVGRSLATAPGDTGFHSDPKDRQAIIDLVRCARKIVAQPAFEGLVFEETRPGPGYESDGEIIAAFDRMGAGAYHASGNCRMGLDADSMVDQRLRVRGVEGARVVDTSALPFLVAGNTNGPIWPSLGARRI